MTTYDVVKKLIGPIMPVGAEHIDEKRYCNLIKLEKLIYEIYFDISDVADYANRSESSMKKSGIKAKEIIKNIKTN